jgi:hypothetical protein
MDNMWIMDRIMAGDNDGMVAEDNEGDNGPHNEAFIIRGLGRTRPWPVTPVPFLLYIAPASKDSRYFLL